jgi:hypothetical protein
MAGAGGIEPPHGGIKIRCLTAWRRPNRAPIAEPVSFCNMLRLVFDARIYTPLGPQRNMIARLLREHSALCLLRVLIL